LLEVLDHSGDISDEEDLSKLNLCPKWLDELAAATKKEGPFFRNEKFTELFLPVRIDDKWMLMLSTPSTRETYAVVFDEWEWDEPKVHKILK
jgi:hypothetical protein